VQTPSDLYKALHSEYNFDFDPCPLDPQPKWDGLHIESKQQITLLLEIVFCFFIGRSSTRLIGNNRFIRVCTRQFNHGHSLQKELKKQINKIMNNPLVNKILNVLEGRIRIKDEAIRLRRGDRVRVDA
jgi:hypothetical protein